LNVLEREMQRGQFFGIERRISKLEFTDREAALSLLREKQGNYSEALSYAEKAKSRGHPNADILLAYAYWRRGEFEPAIASAKEAVETHPSKAANIMALILWSRGKEKGRPDDLHSALNWLKRCNWGDEIGQSYYHNNLANILLTTGESSIAEAHYIHALHLRRKYNLHELVATTYRDLGRLNFKEGRVEMSKDYLLHSLEIRRRISNAHNTAKTLLSLYNTLKLLGEDTSPTVRELLAVQPALFDKSIIDTINSLVR